MEHNHSSPLPALGQPPSVPSLNELLASDVGPLVLGALGSDAAGAQAALDLGVAGALGPPCAAIATLNAHWPTLVRPGEEPALSTLPAEELTAERLTAACIQFGCIPWVSDVPRVLAELAPICVPIALRKRVRAAAKTTRAAAVHAAMAGRRKILVVALAAHGMDVSAADDPLSQEYIPRRRGSLPLDALLPELGLRLEEKRWYRERTRYVELRQAMDEQIKGFLEHATAVFARYADHSQDEAFPEEELDDSPAFARHRPGPVSDPAMHRAMAEFADGLQNSAALETALADPILPAWMQEQVRAAFIRSQEAKARQAAPRGAGATGALAARSVVTAVSRRIRRWRGLCR